jgi:hypothetical protein
MPEIYTKKRVPVGIFSAGGFYQVLECRKDNKGVRDELRRAIRKMWRRDQFPRTSRLSEDGTASIPGKYIGCSSSDGRLPGCELDCK